MGRAYLLISDNCIETHLAVRRYSLLACGISSRGVINKRMRLTTREDARQLLHRTGQPSQTCTTTIPDMHDNHPRHAWQPSWKRMTTIHLSVATVYFMHANNSGVPSLLTMCAQGMWADKEGEKGLRWGLGGWRGQGFKQSKYKDHNSATAWYTQWPLLICRC